MFCTQNKKRSFSGFFCFEKCKGERAGLPDKTTPSRSLIPVVLGYQQYFLSPCPSRVRGRIPVAEERGLLPELRVVEEEVPFGLVADQGYNSRPKIHGPLASLEDLGIDESRVKGDEASMQGDDLGRAVLRVIANPGHELRPVHPSHAAIHDHHVRRALHGLEHLERLEAITGLMVLEPVAEQPPIQTSEISLELDQKDDPFPHVLTPLHLRNH